MTRFTYSPYEQMMQQVTPEREMPQEPPALPLGHPCCGCPYRPCMGVCYRKMLKGGGHDAAAHR